MMNGIKGKMTYHLNLEKNPFEVDLTVTKLETNEQKTMLCIAEFEDKNTILFASSFNSNRPTEFTKRNSVKLKRTK